MIEISQHFAMDTLVVDIGKKQMYGSVCINHRQRLYCKCLRFNRETDQSGELSSYA